MAKKPTGKVPCGKCFNGYTEIKGIMGDRIADEIGFSKQICGKCNGTGEIPCPVCNGSKQVNAVPLLDVSDISGNKVNPKKPCTNC